MLIKILASWALALWLVVGLASSSWAVTGIQQTTALGNLSFAFGEDEIRNEVGMWRDVHRLATGVWSNSGDALQIKVTAQITGAGSLYLRTYVDDVLAMPSDIQLFSAGSANTSERSFTFLTPAMMGSGFHLVRVQWLSGDSYTMTNRSLAVRSAPTTPGQSAQLAFTVPVSGPAIHLIRGGSWVDVPGLTTTFATRQITDLQITFSAEMNVLKKRFLARAVLDGMTAMPADITMEQQDHASEGTRSMTFAKLNVPAGTHVVSIQWFTDPGGDILVGDRTLSVLSSMRISRDGGVDSEVRETTPAVINSTNWTSLMNGVIETGLTPSAAIATTASVEHLRVLGSGGTHMRALVDDRVMQPGDVALDGEGNFDVQAVVFGAKDFGPPGIFGGIHKITLQFRVDNGTIAQIRDVNLSSTAVRRTGADFAQAQPLQNRLFPAQGVYNLLTICIDPVRPGQPPLTDMVVHNVVDGSDGDISIRELYQETSGGRFRMATHTVLGCGTPTTYHPPLAHQGNWYWDNGAFDQMRADAIAAADPDFNFLQYDLNHDGQILQDELIINICVPQLIPDGQAGQFATYSVDGTTLGIASLDCYMSPDLANRVESVALIAHEIAHQTGLAPWDLYGAPEMPGDYSIMGTRRPVHFSAYEKLHYGWVSPALIDLTTWTTHDLSIDAIETTKEAVIVYNPTRNNTEYFMVENRYKGLLAGIRNYDSFISPDAGPVLWHIVEDVAALEPAHPPPTANPATWPSRLMMYGWVAGGIQNWGAIAPGQSVPLTWADGTSVGMTLVGVSTGSTSTVTIRKP
jgi:M6 family metalloprotease-like protein